MKMKFAMATLLIGGLMGCSSTPKTVDNSNVNRREIVAEYRDELNHMEKKATDYRDENRADLRAMISDARVELGTLEGATDESWESARERLANRLNKIETKMQTAR